MSRRVRTVLRGDVRPILDGKMGLQTLGNPEVGLKGCQRRTEWTFPWTNTLDYLKSVRVLADTEERFDGRVTDRLGTSELCV